MLGTAAFSRFDSVAAGLFLVFLLAGCSGGGAAQSMDGIAAEPTWPKGFSVTVWPESWIDGASAKVEMREIPLADGHLIELWAADAEGLKALYFNLDFDPRSYAPVAVVPGELAQCGQLLQLAVLDRPGTVHFGQVLTGYAEQPGFSGAGLLAQVRFRNGRQQMARRSSDAPVSNRSRAYLSWDAAETCLKWGYYCEGDYDQNSEANIADLTPLGRHLGKIGPFAPDSIEAVVDGDQNGEINNADITPIGLNYEAKVAAYNLYLSTSESAKPGANDSASTLEPVSTQLYASGIGERGAGRLRYECALELGELPQPLPVTGYFWVRPADGSHEGTPSTTAVVEQLNQPPEAVLTADPATGYAPLTVTLDASGSTDPEQAALVFAWDWDGAANGIQWSDQGPQSSRQHTYDQPGDYQPMVRVVDDVEQGDSATTQLTVTASQNEPPVAVLTATPVSGDAPLEVELDALGSYDTDGTITKYEFDCDGDGTFELDNGAVPTTTFIYNVPADVTARVRVTDNAGATGVDSRGIQVTDPGTSGVFIRPNSSSYPWYILPTRGSGSEVDPFIVGGAFDPPRRYGFVANTKADFSGTDIDPADLSWYSSPPFIVQWDEPGVFRGAAIGGSGFVFAMDALNSESNQVYIEVVENFAPEAILITDVWIGAEPLSVNFDASRSFDWEGTIAKYEFDLDGDGLFELDNGLDPYTSHLYPQGSWNTAVRVTDSMGLTKVGGALVIAEQAPLLLAPDMIYALPSTTVAHDGEVVTFTVYTNQAAHPFQFMNEVTVVVPAGNYYYRDSCDPGERGGTWYDIDGVWVDVNPTQFLGPMDNLIQERDLGGGLIALSFNVTPLGGSDINLATGPMFNFGLVVHTDIDLTFQRVDGINRTYYSDSASYVRFWGDDDNSGFPGVTLVP